MKSSRSSRVGWFLLGIASAGLIVAIVILLGLFARGMEVDASGSTGYSTPIEIGLLASSGCVAVLAGIAGGLLATRGAQRTNP